MPIQDCTRLDGILHMKAMCACSQIPHRHQVPFALEALLDAKTNQALCLPASSSKQRDIPAVGGRPKQALRAQGCWEGQASAASLVLAQPNPRGVRIAAGGKTPCPWKLL